MGLVVQKFGGTSVAGPERLRAVARRLVDAREQGHDVVGVLSAMGSATDELVALAHAVSPMPDPRELDMLLSAGERISCALAGDGDRRPRPPRDLADGLAGGDRHRHRAHAREDPRDSRRADPRRARRGRDRARRRLPGRLDGARGDDARARRLGRDRGGARRLRSTRRRARSTPTSTASSRPIRGSSRARASSTRSRTRRCSSSRRPGRGC